MRIPEARSETQFRVYSRFAGGREIVVIDFSGLNPAQGVAVIEEAKRLIGGKGPKSIYTLTHVKGARYDRTVVDALRKLVEHDRPYVVAGAVVGLSDLTNVIFNAINRLTHRDLRAFEDEDAAIAWLAGADAAEPNESRTSSPVLLRK